MANITKSFNFRNGVQVDDDNLLVNPSGLVGIGTTIPTEALDVLVVVVVEVVVVVGTVVVVDVLVVVVVEVVVVIQVLQVMFLEWIEKEI